MVPAAWLDMALKLQRAGQLAEAEKIYAQVLASAPDNAEALHLSGLIAATRGDLDSAGWLLERAVAAMPNQAYLHASRGNLYFARGMIPEMTEAYRQALLRGYFREIPAPFGDIIARVGSASPAAEFPADPRQYNSQYLQDVMLDRWVFGGMTNGTFVDIGAHDGVTYSNSYFFEKVRGWHGVAIEPNPDVFKQLAANRQCTALNCCVSEREGIVPFLKLSGYSEMLSGIVDTYDPEHRRRIEAELRQFGGHAETIEVPARRFDDIARECGLAEITYLSIDTEGSELSILRGIDFSKLFVHALTVEYNFEHAKAGMIAFMTERGFECVQTLGHDLLFLNRASPFYAAFTRLCRG